MPSNLVQVRVAPLTPTSSHTFKMLGYLLIIMQTWPEWMIHSAIGWCSPRQRTLAQWAIKFGVAKGCLWGATQPWNHFLGSTASCHGLFYTSRYISLGLMDGQTPLFTKITSNNLDAPKSISTNKDKGKRASQHLGLCYSDLCCLWVNANGWILNPIS